MVYDRQNERRRALADWSGVAVDDIKALDDPGGYEFATQIGIYWILDSSEADDMADEAADHEWRGISSQLSDSPARLRAAENDYYDGMWGRGGRGAVLAVDRIERNVDGVWYIYYQGAVS